MKKILFVTTHFPPDYNYGGVVESGYNLLKQFRFYNESIKLIYTSKKCIKQENKNNICCKSYLLHKWGFSFSLFFKLFIQIKESDISYINGIVTFPTTLAKIYSIILRRPFVVSIRGGLEPWRVRYKFYKKYIYYHYLIIPLLKRARFIHVTSENERLNLIKLGFRNIFLSTNGIDLDKFSILPEKEKFYFNNDQCFVFLYLSRISKEKGIDILLSAYDQFCKNIKEKNHILLIVGPDPNKILDKSISSLKYSKNNIIYLDSLYGDKKIEIYRKSNVFILPSYSENFGNVVAEALACNLPVITTNGTPWKEIESYNCGFYVEPTESDIYTSMQKSFYIGDENLLKMGSNGRKLIFEKYDWKIKAKEVYERLS